MPKPSATLAQLSKPGIYIIFKCGVCRPNRLTKWLPHEAARVFGPETTLDQLRNRAVCAVCGASVTGPDGHMMEFSIDVTEHMYDQLHADGAMVGRSRS